MQDQWSDDTIAIVAAGLTQALVTSGHHRVAEHDPVGDVLHIWREFVGELGDARDRAKGGGI